MLSTDISHSLSGRPHEAIVGCCGRACVGLGRLWNIPKVFSSVLVWALLLLIGSYQPAALGFTMHTQGSEARVIVARTEVIQGASPLGRGRNQNFRNGTVNAVVDDFTLGADLDMGSAANAPVVAQDTDRSSFFLRLTNAERAACLTHNDFAIRLAVNSGSNRLNAEDVGGGDIRVTSLSAVPLVGDACPRRLDWGLDVRLAFDNAVASGYYRGPLQVFARQVGGGVAQSLDSTLAARLPSFLLMFTPNRVATTITEAALARQLTGGTVACSGDYCDDRGRLAATTTGFVADADIANTISSSAPVPTIVLRNMVAARALGCSGGTYSAASYTVRPNGPGLLATTKPLTGIDQQSCGLRPQTANVELDLDLSAVPAGASSVSADVVITVTGF